MNVRLTSIVLLTFLVIFFSRSLINFDKKKDKTVKDGIIIFMFKDKMELLISFNRPF